jgi:sugar phosphate isomerase/epimerase
MLLLSSQSFPHYGLERFFMFAKECGFEGVEITVDENFDTQNPVYLKSLSERFGLPIRAFSMPHKKEDDLYEAFQKTVREFPRTSLNLASPQNFSFGYKKWMETIVPKLCQKYDLKLNRRNVSSKLMFGVIPDRVDNSLFTLREKGHVCLDLSSLWVSKDEPMRTIDFLGDQLRHVYLSNVYKNMPYSPLPAGVLPLESFLKKLAQLHFGGDFTLVLSPKSIAEGEDEKMTEILKDSREFFENYFTKLLS